MDLALRLEHVASSLRVAGLRHTQDSNKNVTTSPEVVFTAIGKMVGKKVEMVSPTSAKFDVDSAYVADLLLTFSDGSYSEHYKSMEVYTLAIDGKKNHIASYPVPDGAYYLGRGKDGSWWLDSTSPSWKNPSQAMSIVDTWASTIGKHMATYIGKLEKQTSKSGVDRALMLNLTMNLGIDESALRKLFEAM